MTYQNQKLAVKERTAADMFDMHVTEFLRLVKLGAFPPPVNIAGENRWRVTDLIAIISGHGGVQDSGQEFE